MAKKKEKSQVINNIQELNLEIDYDKLAEAIVKAQEKQAPTQNEETTQTSGAKTSKVKIFWENVRVVVFNQEKKIQAFLSPSLSALIQMFFNLIALALAVGCITALGFCGRRIYDWIFRVETDIASNIMFIFECIVIFLVSALLALIMRGIANEIGREKDKHYIISVFSGLISLIALIVAIIALSKGVG